MKIVSGGQTGVDRAALDVALQLGIDCGGWCPAGRSAEDGPIDERYPLRETPSDDPARRTERNVVDSDATLIIAPGVLRGGTALTKRLAEKHGRPCLVVDPDSAPPRALAGRIRRWIDDQGITVLNVAGPRESGRPGIGAAASAILLAALG